jgi:hypothetical protein
MNDLPLPASMRVRDALSIYLAENGFTTEGYDSPKTSGSFLGLKFSVPNPPSHQRGVRLHDLHHVATGFGTDHAGEAEISVWQARRGLLGSGMYVTSIVVANVVFGVLLAPRRTLRAIRDTTSGPSLYSLPSVDYEALLDGTVGELRALLEIPERGLATTRGRHAHAPLAGATTDDARTT